MAAGWILWSFLNFNQVGACTYEDAMQTNTNNPTDDFFFFSVKWRDFSSATWDLVWETLLGKDGWSPVSFCFHCVF